MKRFPLIVLANLFLSCSLIAQISFEIPDTICVGEYFSIENTSSTGDEFFWSFCGNDLLQLPEPSSFDIDFLSRPVFMDIQKQGDNYYGFVTDLDGGLARLDFGSSLSNDPELVDLSNIGNMILGMEGIQILQDNDQWRGFFIIGDKLIRLDFGDSLENIPTTTALENLVGFDFPHEIQIEEYSSNWLGLAVNKFSGGSISLLGFENGLGEPPTTFNFGNIGELDEPTGFYLIQDGSDYFLFIANDGNGTISRVELDGALSGTTGGNNLGDLGILEEPRDVLIFEQCNEHFGYVLDKFFPRIVWLDFNGDLKSTPDASVLFEDEVLDFPHSFSSMIRDNGNVYFFVVNVTNKKIVRFEFPTCDKSSIPFYSGIAPPEIKYLQPGNYTVQLIANENSFDPISFCKEIVVLPTFDQVNIDTTLCLGESLLLTTNNMETIWQEQEEGIYSIFEEGNSYIKSSEQCIRFDSVLVEYTDCQDCLIFPNAFTPDEDGFNDDFGPVTECEITFSSYSLQVFNRWGQKVFSSIDASNKWDGKINNQLAPLDTYVWIASFSYTKNDLGFEKSLHGDVTLIR